MKRFHVHVSVDHLEQSIRFYSSMFATEPTVVKADYAKWMLDDPKVNFAISQRGAETGLNHLGIQVESEDELKQMQTRLNSLQSEVLAETDAACCYAKSDKYWVNDPAGIAWETFHTLSSIPVFGDKEGMLDNKSECCIPLAQVKQQVNAPCCVPKGEKAVATGKCC